MLIELDGCLVQAKIKQDWEEGLHFDGTTHVSMATDDKWKHEALALTEKGNWLLRSWSEKTSFSGGYGLKKWRQITLEGAVSWLFANGHTRDALKFSPQPPEEV